MSASALKPHVVPRLLRCLLGILIALIVLASPAAASAATSNSPGPLLWTAPTGVDVNPIDSIACPSTTLCVAVDRNGSVLWSTDPANAQGTWRSADVDGGTEITSIACPSVGLCVAVDAVGNVLTSSAPAGGSSAWVVTRVDKSTTQNNTDNGGAVLMRGVACPSAALCVAVDAAGNALASTDPAGGASAWSSTHIDANTTYGCTPPSSPSLSCQPPLVAISCPSTALCVAVDFAGNVLTTSQPAAPDPWTTDATGQGFRSLYGIACPLISFCATVDGQAGHTITVDPYNPAVQTPRSLPYALNGIWCASASLCLAKVETHGGISGLLGSFDPASPKSSWSLSSLGGINAVACPSTAFCVAADGEGNVVDGLSIKTIEAAVKSTLLQTRHLPTIRTLQRTHSDTFAFTSPIAAQIKLAWTVQRRDAATPQILAAVTYNFTTPRTAKLTLRLTGAGRELFKAATKPLTVTATASFSTSTGSLSEVKKLTFRRPPPPPPRKHHR